MTAKTVLAELKKLGNEQTKKTLMRHGAVEPIFGVKIGDMKALIKAGKNNHPLALELYATGNSDAQYLAGLIADKDAVTKAELNLWMKEAPWRLISNSAVAALAAESGHAVALAEKWIESKNELIASGGWSTLTHYISITPDEEVDAAACEGWLDRVVKEIHNERNEVKAAMNGYVISVGSYVPSLTKKAKAAAKKIGKVSVDQGATGCKTPDALSYIEKIEGMGRIGKKRKAARC
ncbi:MAG: DNA alkylation repair protein [Verrucomicrobiaceae bacterium]